MEPYIGEIKIFSYGNIPRGWAACYGQIMLISQNRQLFALLGTQYGGDGKTTYALPDLRGRVPLQFSGTLKQGSIGGNNGVALTLANLPVHTHNVQITTAIANKPIPAGNLISQITDSNFIPMGSNKTVATAVPAIGVTGVGEPVSNMQPYLGLAFCIALVGVYPERP
jgi:microcystin-dependent protein